ncbi:MAG: DNA translocase FtsK, partial [Dehalococcoidales bacterium]|nr:DNA translocase FtsK [Dehalococcoidales bacterium]
MVKSKAKQAKPKVSKVVKRKNPKPVPKKKLQKRSGVSLVRAFFRFLTSRWVRRTLLLIAILAVLFWQWDNISTWISVTVTETAGLLGWGLILVALAIIIILSIIYRSPLSAFVQRWKLYQWNKWLGGAAVLFAVWGVLAFLEAGGSFGEAIIGDDPAIGVLRVVGLFLLGIILIAPRTCWQGIVNFMKWLAGPGSPPKPRVKPERPVYQQPLRSPDYPLDYEKRFADKRLAAMQVALPLKDSPKKDIPVHETLEDKIVPPGVLVPPEMNRKKPVTDSMVAEAMKNKQESEAAAAKSRMEKTEKSDLRQVAQDVWRKYGQSASLVIVDGWRLPPVEILDKTAELEYSQTDNTLRAKKIDEALASYGVDARVTQINVGPTVTQFGIEPGWDVKTRRVAERDEKGNIVTRLEEVSRTRVKVDKITSLANDLALALASPTIRIEAPIPGKSVVGIEVPNSSFGTVSLRSVIESSNFQKLLSRSKLAMALGKGAGGEAISGDLAKMPHLLIAGATGSGKTVCLNAVICCILMCNTPYETKMIMIDPKRVELVQFNSLPHLATPVIVDTNKALNTMRWLNQEMDMRYQKLAAASTRNIEGYNKTRQGKDKMPNIILIIDELADLMMAGFDEVEHILCRLAQLARAVGIHLVVATQRPSVDVVTGLIKANFPTRISFAVTSQVDSRTILDMVGAEKLLGKGDMLYMPTEEAKPKRLQGCFVSDV